MAEPTPGPWVLRERGLGFGVETEMGTTIATCWRFNRGIPDATPTMEEANARLIAAAPDLYEVVKAIIHTYENADAASDTLDKAYAAIEKAEGR
jgi:hypothetical protein